MGDIDKLIKTIRKLRGKNGCEWDKKQTSDSLLPYFIEEIYEVTDAIYKNNWDNLSEELGDVLIHILFQCEIANDKQKFDIKDVISNADNKLINRHPKVFNNHNHSESVNWESNKQKDKKREYRLDGIPINLPSLIKAQKLQEKAASTGFDWDNVNQVWDKINEEIIELKDAQKSKIKRNIEEEMGDLFFTIVNLCRHLKISPDNSLRKANNKFLKRFNGIEKSLKEKNRKFENISFEEMNQLWNQQKKLI